jgi:hypothetical protein
MSDGLGGGAAVLAGQITGLGDFPDGEERGFIEVQPATSGNVVHRLHEASSGIRADRTGKTGPQAGEEADYLPRKSLSAADYFWQRPEQESRSKDEIRFKAPRFRSRRTALMGFGL